MNEEWDDLPFSSFEDPLFFTEEDLKERDDWLEEHADTRQVFDDLNEDQSWI